MSATLNLEVDIIPVSDPDRSKQFYEGLGWRLDADDSPLEGLRIVQFTPPGSGAAVTFGKGITAAAPGSAEAGLVTSDVEAAHDELAGRGIDVQGGPGEGREVTQVAGLNGPLKGRPVTAQRPRPLRLGRV